MSSHSLFRSPFPLTGNFRVMNFLRGRCRLKSPSQTLTEKGYVYMYLDDRSYEYIQVHCIVLYEPCTQGALAGEKRLSKTVDQASAMPLACSLLVLRISYCERQVARAAGNLTGDSMHFTRPT